MLRRIATSIFYTIILFIVGCIGYKLGESSNWMELAMTMAIGGFLASLWDTVKEKKMHFKQRALVFQVLFVYKNISVIIFNILKIYLQKK